MAGLHAWRVRLAVTASVATALACSGCQLYRARPPDLQQFRAHWYNLSPTTDGTAAFAESLAAHGHPATAYDPSDRIHAAEAELIAIVFNPDLRLARAAAGVERAAADHAGLWDDPVLGMNLTRVLASVDDPWWVMSSISFTLPVSGRLQVEKRRGGAAYKAQVARIHEQEWQMRIALREAWIDWSASIEHLSVLSTYVDELDSIVRIVQRMEEVGELSRLRTRLFHFEAARRRNEHVVLASTVRRNELRLRQMMGLAPHAPLELLPTLHPVDEVMTSTSTDEALLARNVRLRTLFAEYEIAERSLELEIRKQYPDLIIGPGYGLEEGHHHVFVGFAIPIPVLNRNRRAIAEAFAQRDLALAKLETTYQNLIADIASLDVTVASLTDQLQAFENEVVPIVDAQYVEARRVAELGEVDTLLLLETLRSQFEVKVQLIDLRAALSRAMVSWRGLIGPDETLAASAAGESEVPP